MSVIKMDTVLDLKRIFKNFIKSKLPEFKIEEQFPDHKDVKVLGIHPFAYLHENKNAAVIPSIAISVSGRAPDEQTLSYESGETELTEAEVQSQIDLSGDDARSRITPLSDLQALKTFINGEGGTIDAPTTVYQVDSVVTFEIWSNTEDSKYKLFNVVYAIIFGNLKELARLEIDKITLAGDDDDLYNYDFGKILYGAKIIINTNRPFTHYEVDTGIPLISQIDPTLTGEAADFTP